MPTVTSKDSQSWERHQATGKAELFVRLLLWFAVLLAIAAFLCNQLYGIDFWWHLVIGQDILANLSVPQIDIYTIAGSGRGYHDSHWLFQVALSLAHSALGMYGVQLVVVLLWSATLGFCWKAIRKWVPEGLSLALLFVAAMACVERFLPRPELITFLGIACFIWLLQNHTYQKRAGQIGFGLMQAVWSNAHGLFVIGPFLVGCYLCAAAFTGKSRSPEKIKPLVFTFLIVLTATLATPFGINNWAYAWVLFQEVGSTASPVLKSVGELVPTFGDQARSGIAFWFFLVLLALTTICGLTSLIKNRKLSFARGMIVLGMLAAALSGRRNIVLFALASAPFIAEQLGTLKISAIKHDTFLKSLTAVAIISFSLYPLSGRYQLSMPIATRVGLGVTSSYFPHGFPDFIKNKRFEGQILTSNILGGFFLYHFYPERLPVSDGRWEIYDENEIATILSIGESWQKFNGVISKYNVKGLLLQHLSPEAAILPFLAHSTEWTLVYLDTAASFWVKSDQSRYFLPLDVNAPSSLPKLNRIDDGFLLQNFLEKVGTPEIKAQNLRQMLQFGIKVEQLSLMLGQTLQEAGNMAAAEEVFQELLAEYPKNTTAMNQLAYLSVLKGDTQSAKVWLRKALSLEPDNLNLRANYNRLNRP